MACFHAQHLLRAGSRRGGMLLPYRDVLQPTLRLRGAVPDTSMSGVVPAPAAFFRSSPQSQQAPQHINIQGEDWDMLRIMPSARPPLDLRDLVGILVANTNCSSSFTITNEADRMKIAPEQETAMPHVGEESRVNDGCEEKPQIDCAQHYYRKFKAQREALYGLTKLRKIDCGPKKMHWAWWRDKQIARKKKKKCI